MSWTAVAPVGSQIPTMTAPSFSLGFADASYQGSPTGKRATLHYSGGVCNANDTLAALSARIRAERALIILGYACSLPEHGRCARTLAMS